MKDRIRWGILSTGMIAKVFAAGLRSTPDAELVAVGSRSQASADKFGKDFGIARCHGSYEALAADPEVDAIYVATPHPFHKENSVLCLEAGKAVLCEKPFTINAREAEEMIRLSRSKKVFLMEAMWSRFLPAMAKVRELVKDGAIGKLQMLQADFGFRAPFDAKSRIFAPELGGGALLDVGVYTVSLASMAFGAPSRVMGMTTLGKTGVDELTGILLGYPEGQMAVLSTAVNTTTPYEADFLGTEGRIRIHSQWFRAERLTLSRYGKADEVIEMPLEGNGYNYEAAEVGRCLRAGKTESDILPLDESLTIMKTMDDLRAQWGLRYPTE